MDNKMRGLPFEILMSWILDEYKHDETIFGINKIYRHGNRGYRKIFGNKLELPFGPAAGPHTQLAQNIITAYAAGARFFELKTVQIIDGEDLPVSKPCISAFDEGYNVEWSTELRVSEALDEYIKAWFAVCLLCKEFELGRSDGFIFNMSVGYDLDGIKTEKIDSFIEGLKNAENTGTWKTCKQWTFDNLSKFKNIDNKYVNNISPVVSNSITLSTLHGCPPEEIERIAGYLLKEKGLHTYIKCNPTLAGYDFARNTLNQLGYDYIKFDEKHFRHDLQFEDAVPMIKRLQNLAESLSLQFGVKLTNTFPVNITNDELPGDEMYMSGRALYPLSTEVVRKLKEAFNDDLNISYSGGVDARNITSILNADICPVTLATTLLKPGGYQRLYQIAEILADNKENAINTEPYDTDYIYRKAPGIIPDRKIGKELPEKDCYTAPCRSGCPFGQDIPAYLRMMDEKKTLEALKIITERNPLPHITGTICSHDCMDKCTRSYYDESVDIRSVKLNAAKAAFDELLAEINTTERKANNTKIAVVGGGPAGLACAYFLAREGYRVVVFEEKDKLGGVVRHVIPKFRISDELIDKDIKLISAMGVDVRLNTKITDTNTLKDDGFDKVIIATGAWQPNLLSLEEGSAIDALAFLEKLKKNPCEIEPCRNVVVVGGGNTAMDTARAAARIKGVEKVTVVYRRTMRYMPADSSEITLATEEGIKILQLVSPVSLINNTLICNRLKLDGCDLTGRPQSVPTGETTQLPCDMLISAIGNKVDDELFKNHDVYVIGDAYRGPATVAEAIADAAKCAHDISGMSFDKYAQLNINPDCSDIQEKRGVLFSKTSKTPQASRCLECATICNICAEVCPNRANICRFIDGKRQIFHIESMCNECGNCAVFCPYEGKPYLDKPVQANK